KQYFLDLQVYEEDSITPTKAKATYLNITKQEREETVLFEDATKGNVLINQKEEYKVFVTKEGYNPQEVNLVQSTGEDKVLKVFMIKTIKYFTFDLEVQDKETGKPLAAEVFLIDPVTGAEKSLGTFENFEGKFEVGPEHKFKVKAEGYDDA